MRVNATNLATVVKKSGDVVRPEYSEAIVTIGEVDGVVYRIQAISAMKAEDLDCVDIPEWALCLEGTLP